MKPQEPVRAKITVIIPTCNGERYLGALLDSVQAQTRAADEIIVVDSASTDSTLDIVRAYPQVQLLQIERAHFVLVVKAVVHGAKRSAIVPTQADGELAPSVVRVQGQQGVVKVK